jgi:hypothetical protein
MYPHRTKTCKIQHETEAAGYFSAAGPSLSLSLAVQNNSVEHIEGKYAD